MRPVLLTLLVACGGSTSPPGDTGTPPGDDSAGRVPDGDSGEAATWRSQLYPDDWTPSHTLDDGRFLHDHSYAGYRAGEAQLPTRRPPPVVDVRDHGADPTGQADSADAFDAALATLPAEGGTLWLPEGTYVTTRRLTVRRSNVVVAGDGPGATFVHATQDTGQSGGSWLRFQGEVPADDTSWPLAEDADNRGTTVTLEDVASLSVGDGVTLGWAITPAFTADHGMTGTWTLWTDEHKPFFRRTVTAIDGDTVTLDVPHRYDAFARDRAQLRRDARYLTEVGIEDLSVSTVVDEAATLAADRHHALEFDRVRDGWIRRVASFSPTGSGPELQSGGLYVQRSRRVTVHDVHLGRPQNRGGGGNGYLFEISRSSDILVRDSTGTDGRHNFIQNWDFGTSGCVFLRTVSELGVADNGPFSVVGVSEFHHSLAMANLIDQSITDDGWASVNRNRYSSGAGHAGTQNTFWNVTGAGTLRSLQAGWGYVVGTGPELEVTTALDPPDILLGHLNTAPEDHAEGLGDAARLTPPSLYEDQLARRLGATP